ncbi:hypothetical protein K456DRAFT_1909066 [Colletotrichum gloeosporioides 23]|nr:hypothetical protein K456DRAFT_1909066 [Colletotrichum gloeosporioides 23]
MQNDVGEGLGPLRPNDLEQVKSLWRFQVSRAQAENWAFRDMRFLVFDDSSLDYDSDDEDAMMQRALRLSTQVEAEEQRSETLDYMPQNYGDDFECRICSGIPEFPTHRKARFFRLFRPADILPTLLQNRATSVDVCTHYVAVSYCWPAEEVENKGTSVVRNLDGSVRPARALDDVLDRAVDFANSCGLRMIWIDQECLPQPTTNSPQEEVEYQRLGVQAMDIVYNKAIVTAGLHNGTIETQRQADAIRDLIDHATRRIPVPNLSHEFFDDVFDFLRSVRLDRWYTRTWVVQEAISAGDNLMLAFRKGRGIWYSSTFRNKHRHTPRHTLDDDPSSFDSELIIIPMDDFRGMIRSARALLQRSFAVSGDVVIREDTGLYPTLDIAESLHPKIASTNQIPIQMHGGNQYGKRQRVNASTALSFLKNRDCKYQEDRITVVANMCAYEVRLDASEIARHCNSVRIGILALALLNGDTSILVPEVYSFPASNVEETSGFNRSLLSPYDTDPGKIADYTMMKGYLQMPRVCKHTVGETLTDGLRLSAYIWSVEREVDCRPLKEKFAKAWNDLKCLAVRVDRLKNESEDVFHERETKVRAHFSIKWRMDAAKWDILSLGYLPRDSIVWAGLDPDGIECFVHLDAARVRHDPQMRTAVAEVFFGILLELKAHSDSDATGLANSIWQSVRVDMVDTARQDLPDEVNDALFNHPDVLQNPFETLKMDVDGIGGFRQTWFIDRIMRDGALWIGKYQRSPVFQPSLAETIQNSLERLQESPEMGQNLQEIGQGLWASGPDAGEGSSTQPEDTQGSSSQETFHYRSEIPLSVDFEGVSFRDGGEETLLRRQLLLQMTATMKSVDMFMRNENDVPPNFNAGSIAYYLHGQARGVWTAEAEENRVKSLVSAFDVDGPCTVATPFNSEWEVLPHPDLRAMSACWVVESVSCSKKRKRSVSSVDHEDGIRGTGKGRGKDKEKAESCETSTPEQVSAKGKGKEKMEDSEGDIPHDLRLMMEFEEWSKQVPLYRVIHKVKGLWQMMDLPLQEFCFI